MPALRAAIDPSLPLRTLFDAPLTLSDGATVGFEPTNAIGGAAACAARTLRPDLGFDVPIAELPIVNYMSGRDTGIDFTAIPVFLTRRFVHGLSFKAAKGGIDQVSDLNGKRIGVGYWGHTDTTWARGILAEDYGLDTDSVTWITYNEEQVPKAVLPPNIVHVPRLNLDQMLVSGEIDAAIHHHGAAVEISDTALQPLVPDWQQAEKDWFARTGVFPILHVVVIQNHALREHPTLARELYAAFQEAKDHSYEHLRGSDLSAADLASGLKSGFPVPELDHLGPDPMPYGLEANRTNLEMLAEMATAQHVLSRVPSIDEIFEPCE